MQKTSWCDWLCDAECLEVELVIAHSHSLRIGTTRPDRTFDHEGADIALNFDCAHFVAGCGDVTADVGTAENPAALHAERYSGEFDECPLHEALSGTAAVDKSPRTSSFGSERLTWIPTEPSP